MALSPCSSFRLLQYSRGIILVRCEALWHNTSVRPLLDNKIRYLYFKKGSRRYQTDMISAFKTPRAFYEQCNIRERKEVWGPWKTSLSSNALNTISLDKLDVLLTNLGLINCTREKNQSSVFLIEPLHLLQLSISKRLKECTVAYLYSTNITTNAKLPNKYLKKMDSCKNHILNSCSILLLGYKRYGLVSGLQIDFSLIQKSSQLNECLHGMV